MMVVTGHFSGKDIGKHRFILSVENVRRRMKVSQSTFDAWIDEVKSSFEDDNCWALDLSVGVKKDMKVSPRPFMQQMENHDQLLRKVLKDNLSLKKEFQHVVKNQENLSEEVKELKEMNRQLLASNQQLTSHIGDLTNVLSGLTKMLGSQNVAGMQLPSLPIAQGMSKNIFLLFLIYYVTMCITIFQTSVPCVV